MRPARLYCFSEVARKVIWVGHPWVKTIPMLKKGRIKIFTDPQKSMNQIHDFSLAMKDSYLTHSPMLPILLNRNIRLFNFKTNKIKNANRIMEKLGNKAHQSGYRKEKQLKLK